MGLLFLMLAGRLVYLGFEYQKDIRLKASARAKQAMTRPELHDRRGDILAIDVPTSSLYADPKHLLGVDETAEKLSAVLPELEARRLRKRLTTRRRFVWLKRHLTPDERKAVHDLGLPGLYFMIEPKRFYPQGHALAHVTGYVDNDNKGLAGIETLVEAQLKDSAFTADPDKTDEATDEAGAVALASKPLPLSIDLRVQHAVATELEQAISRYKAKAGVGIVLNVKTGEILALSSQPSFDPLNRADALKPEHFDRARRGVFELGSVLKCFTIAMGLDEGEIDLKDRFDVATPIKLGRFTIKDHHQTEDGSMTVAEIFTNSSNVGSARIARKIGIDRHRAFLYRLGLLTRLRTEAGATGFPLQPSNWMLADSLSVAYGYRLSLAPLHLSVAALPLFNGGYRVQPTFLRKPAGEQRGAGVPVLKSDTSRFMNQLMRLNVTTGTGKLANVPAYRVGGKTGTARKAKKGGYGKELITSFLGIFPAESPRYLTYVMLDEPQKVKASRGGNSAAVNAAPLTGRIISRIAPFLGVKPRRSTDN